MAGVSKNNPNRGLSKVSDRVLIKYVRKAKMWARTEFKDGNQKITWSTEKPNE